MLTEEQYQELLARFTADPSSLSTDELTQLRDATRERVQAYHAGVQAGTSDDIEADLDAMRQGRQVVNDINDVFAAQAERLAEAASIAAEMSTDDSTGEGADTSEDTEGDDDAGDEDETETPAEDEPQAETDSTETPADEPVTAAGVTVSDLANRVPAAVVEVVEDHPPAAEPVYAITASAQLGEVGIQVPNQQFATPAAVANTFLERNRKLGTAHNADAPRSMTDVPVMQLSYGYEGDRLLDDSPKNNYLKLMELSRQERDAANEGAERTPEALLAAGGFCAPAEVSYDFFGIDCQDGLLTLPTVGAPRGSIEYPVSVSFQDIVTTAGWGTGPAQSVGQLYTEADDIAAATKNCFQVPCPSTVECTLDAHVTCLTYGNFQQRAWPEFIQDTLGKSLRAHAHLVNADLIGTLVAGSTALTPVSGPAATGLPATASVLAALEFYVRLYRDRYRMCEGDVLDAVFPHWVVGLMIADLVRRGGYSPFDVTSADVMRWLAARGIRAQFVFDWQSISAETEWPATVQFLLYAPGTWIRLDGGTLDLGIVRDSTLNSQNNFQNFVETFEQVCQIGHESLAITVDVCASGAAATALDFTAACPIV